MSMSDKSKEIHARMSAPDNEYDNGKVATLAYVMSAVSAVVDAQKLGHTSAEDAYKKIQVIVSEFNAMVRADNAIADAMDAVSTDGDPN